MKCHACSRELSRKEVLYTKDRLPYCNNPMVCNDDHPNSVKNILARGGAAQMFTEDELESNIFETLNVSAEMKDRIMKIATKPQSIRLSKVDIAYYLIMLQDKHDMSSLSEAIRHCVHVAMNVEPMDEIPAPAVVVVEPVAIEDTNLQPVDNQRDPISNPVPIGEETGIKIVVGDKVSAKDLIMKQIEEKKQEEESEDFVF